MWVANAGDGTVTQLNARDGAIERTIDLHAPVHGIAYGGGSLWVTDPVGNAVIRVPVSSPSSITRIDVGSGPSAIAFGVGTLRRLGYRVSVKHYSADSGYFNALFGDSRHVDAAVLGWNQDYPAPSNFFGGINCPPASPYMCSKAYSRDVARTAAAATASGSNDPWTAFDRKVTESAVVVPFLNHKAIGFVSKRLGNYQHHPEYDLLIDQVWVR